MKQSGLHATSRWAVWVLLLTLYGCDQQPQLCDFVWLGLAGPLEAVDPGDLH